LTKLPKLKTCRHDPLKVTERSVAAILNLSALDRLGGTVEHIRPRRDFRLRGSMRLSPVVIM